MSRSSRNELKTLRRPLGLSGRMARYFIQSRLTPLLIIAALLLGAFAVSITPREEEPQIKVPMVDVVLPWPGATAREVENGLLLPAERKLKDIAGMDIVYGTAYADFAFVIARFDVGQDPDVSVQKVAEKLAVLKPALPPGAMEPVVTLKTIDDVPVLGVTLSSAQRTHAELTQYAEEVATRLKPIDGIAATEVLGGTPRVVAVTLDPAALRGFNLSPLMVWQNLAQSNALIPAGTMTTAGGAVLLQAGARYASAGEVAEAVVGAWGGKPIRLKEVAKAELRGDEVDSYALFQSREHPEAVAAVTLSVAKKRGVNAVELVDTVRAQVEKMAPSLLPADVKMDITRNYGDTAREKSNELLEHMLLATLFVVVFMGFALGRKEALVVAVAIPVTLALTLAASYMFGYTLNRVTLFALIFAIGILVDDAIVVVENMHRHFRLGWGKPMQMAPYAVDEVGNPTILATFTVIGALLPLAFVSGLMGPYMRPIPINASAAMFFSLIVAFSISPWMAFRLLMKDHKDDAQSETPLAETAEEGRFHRFYDRLMRPLVARPLLRWSMLGTVVVLLILSVGLFFVKAVKVKMLPFDNKSEFQVVVDMPEGTTLEKTSAVALELGRELEKLPEVESIVYYIGTHSPINFNGLVRHYDLRRGAHVADLQVNLLPKGERDRQSHAIAAEVRGRLRAIGDRMGGNVKMAEVPPGPPVLSTLVAEVYAESAEEQNRLAQEVMRLFEATDGVVEVDSYIEAPQTRVTLAVDREKAALSGISAEHIAATVRLASAGMDAGLLRDESSRTPVPIRLRLPQADRDRPEKLKGLFVHSSGGSIIPLGELVRLERSAEPPSITHKNLRPSTFVVADVAGEEESPVYAILKLNDRLRALPGVTLLANREPLPAESPAIKWDGEWQITYEVFRDMGIAFAVVLVLIYIMVVGWFKSFITPLVIMAPIPLTLVGIIPGHWVTGVLFTATSMIGFIALAGVIVRNSILLVDFVNLELASGGDPLDAVIRAGAVRFRPIVLTAAALVVGGLVIVLDPIFQGLAVSMIFGVVVATFLTLIVIPVLYYLYLKGDDRYKSFQGESHEN